MQILVLFALLILNTTLSTWNAYASGRIWNECRGFMKLVAWSAVIMSACGFISVLACLLGFGAARAHLLTERSMQVLMELTYVLIILPVLGCGLIITIQSWIAAWKQRNFASVGIAGYNSYAQVSNIVGAARNTGGFMDDIFGYFKKAGDSEDGPQGTLILVLVAIAAALSVGLTYLFWKKGLRNSVSLTVVANAR